jgi:hypothetical protein
MAIYVHLNKKKILKNNVFILIFLKKIQIKIQNKNNKKKGLVAGRGGALGVARPPLAFSFLVFFFKKISLFIYFFNFFLLRWTRVAILLVTRGADVPFDRIC